MWKTTVIKVPCLLGDSDRCLTLQPFWSSELAKNQILYQLILGSLWRTLSASLASCQAPAPPQPPSWKLTTLLIPRLFKTCLKTYQKFHYFVILCKKWVLSWCCWSRAEVGGLWVLSWEKSLHATSCGCRCMALKVLRNAECQSLIPYLKWIYTDNLFLAQGKEPT